MRKLEVLQKRANIVKLIEFILKVCLVLIVIGAITVCGHLDSNPDFTLWMGIKWFIVLVVSCVAILYTLSRHGEYFDDIIEEYEVEKSYIDDVLSHFEKRTYRNRQHAKFVTVDLKKLWR